MFRQRHHSCAAGTTSSVADSLRSLDYCLSVADRAAEKEAGKVSVSLNDPYGCFAADDDEILKEHLANLPLEQRHRYNPLLSNTYEAHWTDGEEPITQEEWDATNEDWETYSQAEVTPTISKPPTNTPAPPHRPVGLVRKRVSRNSNDPVSPAVNETKKRSRVELQALPSKAVELGTAAWAASVDTGEDDAYEGGSDCGSDEDDGDDIESNDFDDDRESAASVLLTLAVYPATPRNATIPPPASKSTRVVPSTHGKLRKSPVVFRGASKKLESQLSQEPEAIRKRERRRRQKDPVQPIYTALLEAVSFSLPGNKSIQKIPEIQDKEKRIILANSMTRQHCLIKSSSFIAPEQQPFLHVFVIFFGGFALYVSLMNDLIDAYPRMSILVQNDVANLSLKLLGMLQVAQLSSYQSIRRSIYRYAEYMEEYILDLKAQIEIAVKAKNETDNLEKRLALFLSYKSRPDVNLHGVQFLKMYGEKPMERKTSQSQNGEKGVKLATSYHQQGFSLIVQICQAVLGEKLDLSRTALHTVTNQIKADVGQQYRLNDVDRQATKRKAALSHEDQIAARQYFLNSAKANPFEGIVFLNMGRAMMSRAQERRFTEYLDLDANEHYTDHCNERNKHTVPKMMVTEFIMDNNKLSYLFSKVGQDDKSIVSAGTHRDAGFSVDVSLAWFLFRKHTMLGVKWPPFEDGYDACKRFVLLPGINAEKPMTASWLNILIRTCYTAIGRYTAGLVTHLDRKEGSYPRRALDCPDDEIEDACWSKGKKAGKKPIYKQCYNKGYSTYFIVTSTDHGVRSQKEHYYIPWDVEVPDTLLTRTWPELNKFFQLVDSEAPGFGDSQSLCGVVRALKLFKKRLYQGTAHALYTGFMKADHKILEHELFQSNEFKLVCQRVTKSCNSYKIKCEAAGKNTQPQRDQLSSLGISGESRFFERFEEQSATIISLKDSMQTMMGMMGVMQESLNKVLKVKE
ncbi:hypothetical protein BCR33DRAFT_861030 [Rhizoclosmatium globosum]|uniref:Ndc10 domain-containing protein n=1 Tax=Rhizoclosmatium globosum TaxID=329046 RepID=A0A1Y2AKA9_9FUNG|nr:hypothetical protein BCR33DRAFT_861030 [Rhizoclosmatium globosum]|eukprot:ORY22993.1 hypothetical protein BCR33DRAFT_861030 [Rhizoclosmatium globosum]